MRTIDARELHRELGSNRHPPVINVLDRDQFESKRIPGSKNIPAGSGDFVTRIEDEVGDRTRPVIVYCASSDCDASEKAARTLEDAGFTNVIDFAPGVRGWEEAGYELEGSAAAARSP